MTAEHLSDGAPDPIVPDPELAEVKEESARLRQTAGTILEHANHFEWEGLDNPDGVADFCDQIQKLGLEMHELMRAVDMAREAAEAMRHSASANISDPFLDDEHGSEGAEEVRMNHLEDLGKHQSVAIFLSEVLEHLRDIGRQQRGDAEH